jgi:hypothetical protein
MKNISIENITQEINDSTTAVLLSSTAARLEVFASEYASDYKDMDSQNIISQNLTTLNNLFSCLSKLILFRHQVAHRLKRSTPLNILYSCFWYLLYCRLNLSFL